MTWSHMLDENSPAYMFAAFGGVALRALAGPGSGKSFAIKRRIAKLAHDGILPHKILAITFTRTAASDLKREIYGLNIPDIEQVEARTVHSLCMNILSKESVLGESGRVPRIILSHELKTILKDLTNPDFGGMREKEKRVKAFEASWARLQHDTPGYPSDPIDRAFESELIAQLKYHECMLVGELVPLTLSYLRNNPLCDEIGRFDHILVDEYQDLNKAEQGLIKYLLGQKSIVIVGDDDQSIYSFKHAHPEGIREVPTTYAPCEEVEFDVCRRCPQKVVRLASSLISVNTGRTLGALRPYSQNPEGDVNILQWQFSENEVVGIVEIIRKESMVIGPEDFLVLTPRRHFGYKIRDALVSIGISAKSYFREDALNTDQVRTAFEFFYLLAHPNDYASLRYLLGSESASGLTSQYSKLFDKAVSLGVSPREVLEKILVGEASCPGTTNICKRYASIKSILARLESGLRVSADQALEAFIQTEDDRSDFAELRQLIQEGIDQARPYDEGQSFITWAKDIFDFVLARISMPEIPDSVDHVRIMSLHASKGLGAKFVVITSASELLLPFINPDLSPSEQQRSEEEQRRLFYVAMTRVKAEVNGYPGKLVISNFRKIHWNEALRMNIPASRGSIRTMVSSRFISELGPERPEVVSGTEFLSRQG
jgi:DNA helicase II / ATP-dependent DNA helicase PcrA